MIKQVESTYFDFQKLMRFIVIGAGLAVPIFFGYWRYTTTSEANNIRDAIEWGILSVPFSFGLWLSTMQIGKRFRHLTLGLIILSAIVHIIFSVYPFLFLPIVICVEIYAVYTLFSKVAIR